MTEEVYASLPMRERQVMDVLYRRGGSTAADVQRALPGELSNSAVRTMLRRLEEKGLIRHEERGRSYVYHPVVEAARAGESALERVVRVFFGGSREVAAAALLDRASLEMDEQELERLADRIRELEEEA